MKMLFSLLLFIPQAHAATQELDKRVQTLQHMEAIQKAMDSFALAYHRIPCPADSTLTSSHASFGKELIDGANCGSDSGTSNGDIKAGSVPVRSLSIPDKYACDGWGRKIAYVIDQRFAAKGSFEQELNTASITESSYSFTTKSDIDVKDSKEGNSINTTERRLGILLSYGQNGYGAFTQNGARLEATQSSDDELENSHYQSGDAFNTLFVQKPMDTSFDDIIYRVQRNAAIPLRCLGVDVPSRIGGHTEAGPGYPAYNWEAVVAGQTSAPRACHPGYTGQLTRKCDENGQWQPITSTCNCDAATLTDNTTYNAPWPKADDLNIHVGGTYMQNACLPGYTGSVTATCQPIGGWGVTENTCQ